MLYFLPFACVLEFTLWLCFTFRCLFDVKNVTDNVIICESIMKLPLKVTKTRRDFLIFYFDVLFGFIQATHSGHPKRDTLILLLLFALFP